MAKLVVLAIFTVSAFCFALSAPLEGSDAAATKNPRSGSTADKANSTNAPAASKDIDAAYTPYLYYPQLSQPLVIMQRGQPMISGSSQVGYLPYMSSPYVYQPIGRSAEGKTFGHLNKHRPLVYASRPEYYSAPVQTYSPAPVHSYDYAQPAYYQPASYVSYSYPTTHASQYAYPAHAGQYYRSVDDDEQQPQQPTGPYAPQYSNYMRTMPNDAPQYAQFVRVIADDGTSSILPASPRSSEYSQIEDFQKQNIVIDDKFNMQIKPNYLIDRINVDRPNPQTLFARDAAESSFDTVEGLAGQPYSQVPPVNPGDRVYVVMNRYDNVQGASAGRLNSGRSAEESNWYYSPSSTAAQTFSSELAPMSQSLKDGSNPPYSPENIQNFMSQFYWQQPHFEAQLAPPKSEPTAQQVNNSQTLESIVKELQSQYIRQSEKAKERSADAPSKPDASEAMTKNNGNTKPEKTDKPKQ